MTTNHIFYIPVILLVGLILGAMLGRKSVEAAAEEEERLRARRAARRNTAPPAPTASEATDVDSGESESDAPS